MRILVFITAATRLMPVRSVCLQEAPAGAEEEEEPDPEPDPVSARAAAQRKYICVCLCDTSRRAAGGRQGWDGTGGYVA